LCYRRLRLEALVRACHDLARRERRVLLTLDKGIADVRANPPESHAGIVLFRPPAAGARYDPPITCGITWLPSASRS
jgi:hypothetical protein